VEVVWSHCSYCYAWLIGTDSIPGFFSLVVNLDQQSSVLIGHFCQIQPQSPGTYGWLLPRQEQEDNMLLYSMIAFGCKFYLSWQWVRAAGIVVIF
jgi:hypothetical protein